MSKTGPCARQVVKATIVTPSGRRFAGTNHCQNAQSFCPRDGYREIVFRRSGGAEQVLRIPSGGAELPAGLLAAAESVKDSPRYPTGEGYELCADICEQPGHAEIQALFAAALEAPHLSLAGSEVFLEGHTYACVACQRALADAGVSVLVIGAPPAMQ